MAQVLIRNLDESVIAGLRMKAKIKGQSLEQELRDIITSAAPFSVEERVAISAYLRAGNIAPDFDVKAAIRSGRDDEFLNHIDRNDAA